MIIAVDFDGTLCENKYPEIGEPNTRIIKQLLKQQENGDKFILWTCRTGKELDEALIWCREFGIVFDAVNENLPERIEQYGGDCRKVFADEYWDDKACNVSCDINLNFFKWINCHDIAPPVNEYVWLKVVPIKGGQERIYKDILLHFLDGTYGWGLGDYGTDNWYYWCRMLNSEQKDERYEL